MDDGQVIATNVNDCWLGNQQLSPIFMGKKARWLLNQWPILGT